MSRDAAKAIARLRADRVRAVVSAALLETADAFEDLPAPQVLLRGDAWTGVTTTIDADGWRAVLITAGGRRTASRTCTLIDPDGVAAASFAADAAATRALAAAAGCLAPRLVRADQPVRLGVLGAGPLGRTAVAELTAALDVERVAIHDVDPAVAGAAADLGTVVADAATAVRDATLIVTATNARDPVLRADWVAEGATVLALGADRCGRRELDYRLVADASFVAADSVPVARALADDLRDCVAEGHLDWQEVTPAAEVLAGRVDARVRDEDLVVAKLIDATPLVLALARAALGA